MLSPVYGLSCVTVRFDWLVVTRIFQHAMDFGQEFGKFFLGISVLKV
jgi:hypothetical protein